MNEELLPIKFTQYMRPDGRQVEVTIHRPAEVAKRAEEIYAMGLRLEIEHLTTGDVSMTIADPERELDTDIRVVPNGPEVPKAVDDLILNGLTA